jgi:hypothetical protein
MLDWLRKILGRKVTAIESLFGGIPITVTETARRLRETLPRFNRWRVNTIARTELNNAWTRGSVISFQEIRPRRRLT